MRNILLALVVAALPASAAIAAGLSDLPKQNQDAAPGRQLPVKRTGAAKTCAAYGPGFVKVDGTDTCVKLGGAVGVQGGGSR
jgi:hypothetical protein